MRFHKVDTRGKFWLPRITSASTETHNGIIDEGRMFYASDTDAIYFGDHDEWILITRKEDVVEDGTKVLMGDYPLPSYWNISTTENDIVPIITHHEEDVGNYGGSWTISGISSGGSHDHGGYTGTPDSTIVIGSSEIYTTVSHRNHMHSLQADGIHSHTFDGTWRPAYKKMMMVRYDVS